MIPLLFFAAATIHFGPMTPNVPVRQPQIAADSAHVVLAFGAGNTVYFSSSADEGKTFGPAVKVAQLGSLMLGRHRGPRVALAGNAIVITAVAGEQPNDAAHAKAHTFDGDLLAWRSQDGGKTWSKGQAINDAHGSAAEGLDALASDGKGTLLVVWLDHRGPTGKQLYATRSTDGGVTWSKNFEVYGSPDGSICDCCHPSVAIDADGEMAVMWRNSLGGSRDLYVATSRDGVRFSAAQKLGNGTWKLNACPMDGGGLAIAGGRIVTAWRRDQDVFLDEPGKAEQQLGAGKDVALALSGGKTYVAWVTGTKVELWVDGKLEELSAAGAFPALSSLPDGGVLASWEENGGIQIRRLP